MISPKNIPIRLTMILASLCSTAQGGEGFYCNTRDGACVPKRLTYGYTPTTWRRWPNEGTPSVARPPAEQIPTPARQTPPSTGPGTTPATPDEAPLTPTPDESPLVPTDSVPSGSTPSAEPLLTPPFDDTPPAPPQGPESGSNPPAATTAPGETTVPKSLAEPPSRIRSALPDADPPPAMPDDDPFKDDLPGPPNPLDEPTKKGARLTPAVDENIRTTATRWQSPARAAEAIVEGPQLKPIPSSEEPRRLQPVDEKAEGTVALPPVNVPVKHNPLRAAAQERRSDRVVPTANWTVEQRASTATAASRRNPLRSN
jgi:hypothetical protein